MVVVKKGRMVDPKMPKRPHSSWNFFVKMNYSTAMRVAPAKSFGDLIRTLAKMWAQMPDKKKRVYVVHAKGDRRRWHTDMYMYMTCEGALRHEGVKKGQCIKCGKLVKKVKAKKA